jgi:Tol biopolymer transport system component
VLYELLTGRPVFTGDTITDVLGALVKSDPDWTALPRETPPPILRLLRRCLAKDPTERLHAIADARLEIAEARAEPDAVVVPVGASSPRREPLPRILAGAALVAVLALAVPAVLYFRTTAPVQVDTPEVRLQVITPPTTDPISLSLSPDGHRLVFVALGADGSERLWLRALDVVTAQPLAGTENAIYPFWSPDSRSIGFFAQGKLKRIDIGSGQPQVLADAPGVRGGSWNRDGVILFSPSATQGLFRVPASGGDAVPVTQLAPRQTSHRFPQFLPDGRQFLYFGQGSQDVQGVYLGALDSSVTTRLTAADSAAMYASPGYIMYVRQGALVARRFDAAARALSGDPVTVADPTAFDGGVNLGAFSASAAGAIAHRAGGPGRRQLTWFDREGRALGTVGPPDESNLSYPDLSPDGLRVVVDRTVQDNRDLWLIDVSRGLPMRFTFDPNVDSYAIWSPDGSRIVFRSNRGGTFDFYQKPTGSGATETVLLASDQTKFLNDWSSDGRFLLYASADPKASNDIWVARLQARSSDPRGDLTPFPFVNTAYDELSGQFSPDGRWVAYQSNESGRNEIYVQPFPGPGDRSRVSTAGGSWPRWRPDGRELFYVALDGKLMGVPTLASGSTLQPGTPVTLFQTRMPGFNGGYFKPQYDVAADGRFLINHPLEDAASPITVILNWAAGLNK